MPLRLSYAKQLRGLVALGLLGLMFFPCLVASAEDEMDIKGGTPPGDCTWPDYKSLRREVAEKCKRPENRPQRCESHHACFELEDFARRFRECIVARETLSNKCFGGGDKTHHDEVARLENGLKNCNDKLNECRKKEANKCPQ